MSLLARVDSRFTAAALTYFLADIDQHLDPSFVSNCSSDAPRYMFRDSALYPFSLNTHLIPSIFFMWTQMITSISSTQTRSYLWYSVPSDMIDGLIHTSGFVLNGVYSMLCRRLANLDMSAAPDDFRPKIAIFTTIMLTSSEPNLGPAVVHMSSLNFAVR